MKKSFALLLLSAILLSCSVVFAKSRDSRYDYVYENPPKPSLQVRGRYIVSTSGVRYVHSPSKSKRASHAARINAYNYQTTH